jgi:hypothetical protein
MGDMSMRNVGAGNYRYRQGSGDGKSRNQTHYPHYTHAVRIPYADGIACSTHRQGSFCFCCSLTGIEEYQDVYICCICTRKHGKPLFADSLCASVASSCS